MQSVLRYAVRKEKREKKMLKLRYSVSDPNYGMLLEIRRNAKTVTQEGYIPPSRKEGYIRPSPSLLSSQSQ